MAKSGKMKNARWFRIVCATLTYIYTIAVCSTSEVVEELVCMGRWRPPGALHVHLGLAVAPPRRAAPPLQQPRRPQLLQPRGYCDGARRLLRRRAPVAECMHTTT